MVNLFFTFMLWLIKFRKINKIYNNYNVKKIFATLR